MTDLEDLIFLAKERIKHCEKMLFVPEVSDYWTGQKECNENWLEYFNSIEGSVNFLNHELTKGEK